MLTAIETVSVDRRVTRQTIGRRFAASAVIAMLAAAVLCIAIAPTLMPDSYSVVEHSVSESAAQGVEGAWLARTGLLLFGFSVLALAGHTGRRWGPAGRMLHRVVGVCLVAVATFAHMPWENLPYDEFEDLLHSIGSFGVGFAFTAGVVAVSLGRPRGAWRARLFDWVAIVAAFVIPMTMFNVTGIAGVVQRVMFGLAFVWYGAEAIRSYGGA
jgi:hypothetical protein